jgi:hypothetical protein
MEIHYIRIRAGGVCCERKVVDSDGVTLFRKRGDWYRSIDGVDDIVFKALWFRVVRPDPVIVGNTGGDTVIGSGSAIGRSARSSSTCTVSSWKFSSGGSGSGNGGGSKE